MMRNDSCRSEIIVTVHGSGTRIYCVFRENMIQVRGDFCEAKL